MQHQPNQNTKSESPIVISPSPGRVVWYVPTNIDIATGLTADPGTAKLAAMVCWVWGARMVNLLVINTNGVHFPKTSVVLLQEGDPVPVGGGYCMWMPYQLSTAKKGA